MRLKLKLGRMAASLLLVWLAVGNFWAQQPQAPVQSGTRVRVSTEVVLVNVVARDKNGNLIRDLKKEDFTVLRGRKEARAVELRFRESGRIAWRVRRGNCCNWGERDRGRCWVRINKRAWTRATGG